MDELSNQQKAVELLQQLGFKEYEARCFVALSRLPKATAKEISRTSDVPRTRVYDAIRVLETKGLVEVQHSNPQQFRAVPVDEAVDLLRGEYESRAEELTRALEDIEPASLDGDAEATHEVWSLTGREAIERRTRELITSAESDVVLVLGQEETVTDELLDCLNTKAEDGVEVVVGAVTDDLRDELQERLPDVAVFTSGLEWLSRSAGDPADTTDISRLLLVDGNTILVSTVRDQSAASGVENAVFGRGFDNGIVVIARRLMAAGFEPRDDTQP